MAQKIIDGAGRKEDGFTYLEDLDLKVGGEGMRGFYDKMLPAAANKLGKKYGAKVETTSLDVPSTTAIYPDKTSLREQQGAWSLPITPAMRDAAMAGQPLFQAGRAPVAATLTGQELGPTQSFEKLRDAASQHYQTKFVDTGLRVTNDATGVEIQFNKLGRKKTTQAGESLLKLVPALPDLLRKGTLLDTAPDLAGRPDVKAFHRYLAAADVGGERLDVVLVVREARDGTFHYALHHDRWGAGDRSVSSRPQGGTLDQSVAPPALDHVPGDLNIALVPAAGKPPQGSVTLADDGAFVRLFETADESTFMHEAAHIWLREIVVDAARADAPGLLKDDRDKILQWLEIDDAAKIGREHHEKFARGFEQWLRALACRPGIAARTARRRRTTPRGGYAPALGASSTFLSLLSSRPALRTHPELARRAAVCSPTASGPLILAQ
jgi:hypothetical protein